MRKVTAPMKCPKCETEIASDLFFCTECGEQLRIEVRGATDTIDEMQMANAAAATANLPSANATQARSSADPQTGDTIDGRYELGDKIGSGGMGAVYSAKRLSIGDQVAVKILHKSLTNNQNSIDRFRLEAQATATLKHQNAVTIYDFGVLPDGQCYIVMELVEGQSLRQIIKNRNTMSPEEAVQIASQVAAALDEAHRNQIVHRDIKPDNIVINQNQTGLHVKVLDFGIAKLRNKVELKLTQEGSIIGTPHYMSPEQCLGEELDHRSDIYSLGVVLFELLVGVVPFNSPTLGAITVQHINQPPPSMRAINMMIPPLVEDVVLQALKKKREERPQTAGELAQKLEVAAKSGGQAIDGSARMVDPGYSMETKVAGQKGFNFASGYSEVQTDNPQPGSRTLLWVFAGLLALIAIGLGIGFAAYQFRQREVLPDHLGMFVQSATGDRVTELGRRDIVDINKTKDDLLKDDSVPDADSRPVLILYSLSADVPINDLKLIPLNSLKADGKMKYIDFQAAPIEGQGDMKRLRIPEGLANGKYAFAVFSGYFDDGKHRLWPFQVRNSDRAENGDLEKDTSVNLKPKEPKQQVVTANTQKQPPIVTPSSQTQSSQPDGSSVAYCTRTNVVLRGGPSQGSSKVGRITRGQKLYVLSYSDNYEVFEGSRSNFAYVQTEGGKRGWVYSAFLR